MVRYGTQNGPRLLERRPAPVLFVTAGPLLTGIVEQPLSHVFPDRVRTIKPHSIDLLNFDDPAAAAAGDPQQGALELRQPRSTGLQTAGEGARVLEHRLPVFRREWLPRGFSRQRWLPACFDSQLFHLLRSRHAPTCRS